MTWAEIGDRIAAMTPEQRAGTVMFWEPYDDGVVLDIGTMGRMEEDLLQVPSADEIDGPRLMIRSEFDEEFGGEPPAGAHTVLRAGEFFLS
jgi:hypothetical protein